ncbi:MAG: hypothetical protein II893_02295 [Methanomicrobium sp.]|nr:hypothetical protein [Methanomicrobium sp.]
MEDHTENNNGSDITVNDPAKGGSESGGIDTDSGQSEVGNSGHGGITDLGHSGGRNAGHRGNTGSGHRAGNGSGRGKGSHGLLKKVVVIAGIILLIFLALSVLMNLNAYMNPTSDPNATDSNAAVTGAFTVTDRQNPSKSNTFADNQTGVIYSNTLSLPYGSRHYILSLTNLIPPVTISASNMVPKNSQALLEFLLRDSKGNTIENIQHDSSDITVSEKITIRKSGDYTLVIDGKFIESVDISIEKNGFLIIPTDAKSGELNISEPASESQTRQE